jgi:hypothetical protein
VTVDVLTGALHTVGPLGVDVISESAFDTSGNSGVAYATMKRANSSQSEFWTVDLVSGAAANRGAIGGGITVTAMTPLFPNRRRSCRWPCLWRWLLRPVGVVNDIGGLPQICPRSRALRLRGLFALADLRRRRRRELSAFQMGRVDGA